MAATLAEEFPDAPWQVVAGMRGKRSPAEILEPLNSAVGHLWATAPDDPGAIAPEIVASSGGAALGCESTVVNGVPEAVAAAMEAAGSGGSVVVTGSLYVAGEARAALVGTEFRPSGVHVRFGSRPRSMRTTILMANHGSTPGRPGRKATPTGSLPAHGT